jgi:hypothetical protein
MKTLLDFNFLVILNLLVLLLWPASGASAGDRRNVLSIIMVVLTVIAVVVDIVFLAIRLVGASS